MHKLKVLKDVVTALPPSTSLLLMGDLNTRSNSWENWQIGGQPNSMAHKMGDTVINMCSELGLTVMNNGAYTREAFGTKSAPDVTLCRNTPMLRWHVDHRQRLNSDHLPILITSDPNDSKSITKWNLRKVDWEKWSKDSNDTLLDFINESNNLPANDSVVLFTNKIKSLAEASWPKKQVCKHSKAFWNETLTNLRIEIKKARKIYDIKGDPHSYGLYKTQVHTFINEYNRLRDLNWKNLCSQLDNKDPNMWRKLNDLKSNGQLQTVVQPLTDNSGTTHFNDKDICEILIDTHIKRENTNTNTTMWQENVDMAANAIKRSRPNQLSNEPHNEHITGGEVA